MPSSPPSSDVVAPVLVGVDIGGTFTDFVVAQGGRLEIYKQLSTPDDPSRAFLAGLEALGVSAGARYVHGSTVATNAVLERHGARAALLTTEGFRDLLELGRQTRTHLYALHPERPEPLIPRSRCFEVAERIDQAGTVLCPLDEDGLTAALDAVVASGAESLAVCFLFSFVNPAHEQRVGELAAARGLSISLSSEILPEYREYERASTTAANAYVAPLMDRYLRRLDEQLSARGRERLQIMQSNGGVISVEMAQREAVRTVLSGPAGGVVGAWKVAARAGFERAIAFDMGGTSTDVSLIDGEPRTTPEGAISGLPIRVPMLDIHTVGAGGGSLVRVDAGGGLRVGPESAGADPGPAAYGRGERATVSDANVVLGRLVAGSFLGGRMALDVERALAALSEPAERLTLSVETLAEWVIRVANVQMARAIRKVSVERGHDPRRFCLVAFGGGGPLHACELAEETGIPTVLVPRYPGILSALGMLLSDLRKEYSRTVMTPLTEGDATLGAIEATFLELEARARAELAADGVTEADLVLERWLDLRYRGQSYELQIPVVRLEVADLAQAFHDAHAQRFGYASPGAPCEIVNVRLLAVGRTSQPPLPRADCVSAPPPTPVGRQPLYTKGAWLDCPIYAREALQPGMTLTGPALVVQEDTTVWIAASWDALVDEGYNLVVRRLAAATSGSNTDQARGGVATTG